MKSMIAKTMVASAALCVMTNVFAADRATPEEAVAIVKKAVAYLKENGSEKAYATFNNPSDTQFHDRDLYIFVYDLNGNNVAHGVNSKMVGKNLLEMKDHEGKAIIKGFIDVAKKSGKGWVDYKWPNPVTKTVEAKSSYVEKVDNVIVGSGVYK